MPYQKTGKPVGRPPNSSKPAVIRENIRDVVALLRDTTIDRASRPMTALCPDCFPEGWGAYEARNCQHGIWVKRL